MPYTNEHSARLRDPGDFKDRPDWSEEGKFRRTEGGELFGGNLIVPRTISVIWGQLKEQEGDAAFPQALRFPTGDWTEAQARAWLEDHKVEFESFEPASGEKIATALCQEIPAEVPDWVMIARTGTWRHPQHLGAVLQITAAHLQSALAYYERHYEGRTDVVIDYHHQSYLAAKGQAPKAPAAGWIQDMELRAGGTELWGRALWTVEARQDIAAREFRYLSPHLGSDPDRLTGEPVLMQIVSVALTNTPFLTELQALNQNAATEGGDAARAHCGPSDQGGESMRIIEALAHALGKKPEEVASALGLAPDVEEKAVAEALMGLPGKVQELEAKVAEPRPVSEAVASLLGVDPKANEQTVKTAVAQLKLGGEIGAVRAKLSLGKDAGLQDVLAHLDTLQVNHLKQTAQELVDKAVEAGKVPPAQREALLSLAFQDIETARSLIASAPVITALAQHGNRADTGEPVLTAEDRLMIKLTGVSEENFLAAKKG